MMMVETRTKRVLLGAQWNGNPSAWLGKETKLFFPETRSLGLLEFLLKASSTISLLTFGTLISLCKWLASHRSSCFFSVLCDLWQLDDAINALCSSQFYKQANWLRFPSEHFAFRSFDRGTFRLFKLAVIGEVICFSLTLNRHFE